CRRENRRRGAGGCVPNSQSTVNQSPGFRPDGGGQARRSIMSPRVRAVAGFKRFTDPQLITTGRGVVKEMKDNPNFPNPPEELKTLESAVKELSAALAAQVQGGTAATAHKNNKRDAVIELLVKLAHYVEDNCGQNPASGFQLATNNRAKSPV